MSTVVPGPGWIGLVRIDGRVGLAIRVGQWLNGDGFANFEHAFVHVGGGQIVEAEPGGARLAQLSEYDGRPIVWLACPADYGLGVAAAARQLAGVGYSAADYFALAAHRVHLPVPGLRAYINRSGRLICSQLADLAARRAGWHLFTDGRWPGYVTPGALYRIAPQWAPDERTFA